MALTNGDLNSDQWLRRVQLMREATKLVGDVISNVGFPILMVVAIFYFAFKALPLAANAVPGIYSLSNSINGMKASLDENTRSQRELNDMLHGQNAEAQAHNLLLQNMDSRITAGFDAAQRSADAYHQDYMLTHHEPLPSDPIPRRHVDRY